METTAVLGVGSAMAHSLEPVMYGATFSMQIVRYTNAILKGNGTNTPDRLGNPDVLPENLKGTRTDPLRDGNSLIDATAFNPQLLLLSTTFDIEVYEKKANITGSGASVNVEEDHGLEGELMFVLKDCRLSRYNFNFAPGELLIENVSGLCRLIEDSQATA